MATLSRPCRECQGRGFHHAEGCDLDRDGCALWKHERCRGCNGLGELPVFCAGCGDDAAYELASGAYCSVCACEQRGEWPRVPTAELDNLLWRMQRRAR